MPLNLLKSLVGGLYAETMCRGLVQAKQVVVLTDLYHAREHVSELYKILYGSEGKKMETEIHRRGGHAQQNPTPI